MWSDFIEEALRVYQKVCMLGAGLGSNDVIWLVRQFIRLKEDFICQQK